MVKRNESVAETRQRIVAAATQLHGTLGPAATSIAAIADAAGVTRVTVYRHFADAEALFGACSAHWITEHLPPQPELWAAFEEPAERLRAALSDLYRFYENGEQMLALVRRDREHVPESITRQWREGDANMRDLVVRAFRARGAAKRRIRAAIGHALSFDTWRSLCREQGLSRSTAVDVMVRMVVDGLATAPLPRRTKPLVRNRLGGGDQESRTRMASSTSAR